MPEIDPSLLSDFEKTLPHHHMMLVEGGEFMMGSEDEEARENEKPVHRVRVDSFYMGRYPVTQALWKAVMGKENNPSQFKGDNMPVDRVSWVGAQNFIEKLNEISGKEYRLPTEAEWEFAARGGINSEGYLYAGSDKLKEVGWYGENSQNQTHQVGQKLENELGLYDLSGNVWEWCQDLHGRDYYKQCHEQGLVQNPGGRAKGVFRVLRGGRWIDAARRCQVSYRGDFIPGHRYVGVGFRLALSLQSGG